MEKREQYGWTEAAPHTSSYLNAAILKLARESGARTILDAGCGNGVLADDLTRAGYDVLGVDGDEEAIDIARRKFAGIRFEVGRFERPAPGVFDFVCSTEVVEHLYAPHELARYCFEALKPGGTLAISTPYHGYLKNLAFALIGAWDRHLTANWYGGHIKFWSRATLTKLLNEAGFTVTGFVGVGRFPYLWKSMILVATKRE